MVPLCLGATVPWCHGTMAVPWCHGATMPRCHGATLPRWDGAMEPWCQGALVPRCHGATAPWCHGAMVPRCLGAMVPCAMVPRLLGATVPWCHHGRPLYVRRRSSLEASLALRSTVTKTFNCDMPPRTYVVLDASLSTYGALRIAENL
ncbi:hypothetical protein T459_35544 [Capsicum annuum]|uniref:Uncharacterized protein n=1 Tax=Capsicum annuum TaxID=4072 RepID=A0A2G2XJ37_CAPAN|nr:hypothetical protein T459_35544 [Capsicum annuum]